VWSGDLVDALVRLAAGVPAAELDWRGWLRLRDSLDALLNGEVNRQQHADPERLRGQLVPPAALGGTHHDKEKTP
jgi:hypothetical protein